MASTRASREHKIPRKYQDNGLPTIDPIPKGMFDSSIAIHVLYLT